MHNRRSQADIVNRAHPNSDILEQISAFEQTDEDLQGTYTLGL